MAGWMDCFRFLFVSFGTRAGIFPTNKLCSRSPALSTLSTLSTLLFVSVGVADPKAIRAKFQEAVLEQMPLMDRVQLDTMVSLIDCSTFEKHFSSAALATKQDMPELFYADGQAPPEDDDSLLEEEWMKELPPKLLQVVLQSIKGEQEEGEPEGVADLLTSQTETADLLVLNKQDLVDDVELSRLKEIVAALNPRAKVLVTSFGQVGENLDQVLGIAKGQGVAISGAVDDHRDYVLAASLSTTDTTTIEKEKASSSSSCEDPDCTDPSHSHSHSHDHDTACEEPACTDPTHDHSHSHDDHAPAAAAADCVEPGCTDPSHDHSHSHSSHSHDHKETAADDCAEPECTDPTHDHSHSHNHAAAAAEDCAEPECTDPTHDHSHSHNHAADATTSSSDTFVGIGSFVYRARRPFHPGRLISFLRHLPVVRGIPDGDESSKKDEIVEISNDTKEKLQQCLRSKGFVWCANSHTDALYWSHAGSTFELSCLGQWWATLPREQWPEGVEEYVLRDFDLPAHDDATNPVGVGDRRQEIVFIGPTLGEGAAQRVVSESLDQCLLTHDEYEEYQSMILEENNGQLRGRFANVLESKYVTY
jgi:G3E family GTPase